MMHDRDDHWSARSSEGRRGRGRPRHRYDDLAVGSGSRLDAGAVAGTNGYARGTSLQYWWSAVSGGRFFSRWTALASLPMAVTVLGAYAGVQRLDEIPVPLFVSVVSWALQVVLVLPAAWAERRLQSAAARAAVVLTAMVVVSGVRPLLNDLLLQAIAPELAIGNLPARVVTNVVAGVMLFSLVAIAVDAVGAATVVKRRLRDALSALAGSDVLSEEAMRSARAYIVRVVGGLRWRASSLLRGAPVDFDRVRAFSEEVRASSHRLDEHADAVGIDDTAGRGTPPWASLAPPPVGLVGVLYVLATVPYAVREMSGAVMALCAAIVLSVSVLGDLLTRSLVRDGSPRVRGLLIVAISVVVGAVVSLVLLVVLDNPVAFVALPAMILLTVLLAVAEGALRCGAVEQRWLTQALAAYRGAATTAPSSPSGLLHAAASVLHGEVQGRCVVFAASLEDAPATAAQTTQFVAAVSRALDHAVVPQTVARDEDPFAALIAAWSQVLHIDCEIEEGAASALRDRANAREVADVVSEAFVNAVKHSAARAATVELRRVGSPAHPVVEIEVASPGRLRDPRATPGRALSQLPGRPRLAQRGADVVLTAAVPVS